MSERKKKRREVYLKEIRETPCENYFFVVKRFAEILRVWCAEREGDKWTVKLT